MRLTMQPLVATFGDDALLTNRMALANCIRTPKQVSQPKFDNLTTIA